MNSDARSCALAAVLSLMACRPDFGLPVSVVTEPRILAVQTNPPEVAPGASVHLSLTAGSPEGELVQPASFGFCTSARPLVEQNVVNADCLGSTGAFNVIATAVREADATVPTNACLQFGPDTPPQKTGEPPFRPRDPDVTGGYYQPIHVALEPGLEAIALVRIRCNLPGASSERSVEFGSTYLNNVNPQLASFDLLLDGSPIAATSVPPNTSVTLRATWLDGDAEPFVVHDRSNDTLTQRREALRVSWFTTAGVIPLVASGRGEDDLATTAETTWQTPPSGTSGTLWAVLRDSRGGISVRSIRFATQ